MPGQRLRSFVDPTSAPRVRRGARSTGAAQGDVRALVAQYPTIALVLQGGGALGAYQCGVYEGLHAAGLRPNVLAGISIGAINAALIAGSAPETRVETLCAFWEHVCEPNAALSWAASGIRGLVASLPDDPALDAWATALSAGAALWQGQRGFFQPRPVSPWLLSDGSDAATSVYDTAPLRATLERFVDFDRINAPGAPRLVVGATDVETGNFRYFDSREAPILVDHVMASGALPPAFPAVEIDGRRYWDGGLVSNTPLEHVLDEWPRKDTLALQVDLWSARGPRPRGMMDVLERIKDIQYSSRTRHGTDTVARMQALRTSLTDLIGRLPDKQLPPELEQALAPWLDDRVFNVVHLIYQAKPYEEQFKDYAFGLIAMREHWRAGLRSLAHAVVECAGTGVCTSDYDLLAFQHVRRPIYPLDKL